MSKKTEYAKWSGIMRKLNNQVKADEEKRKAEIAKRRKERSKICINTN